MRDFFKSKTNWLILMACNMWLDGMTAAYNLTHGWTEHNPILAYWFSTTPLGFILSIIPMGLVMYFLIRQWDKEKSYIYIAWVLLAIQIFVSWTFNLVKIGAISW